ncbi:hypothetical protein C791_1450 [Amycolatopsis azurea DSM 43854]|uniref:Uncharacterized protein n=1 Tax=Amycolatopsis azurea DSM 43854 TaxID=1238180 RepID=M2PTU5_9PSEU|nr:hypothetical protein C791_1450 [Amycolatopsis azurea DSM 43854]
MPSRGTRGGWNWLRAHKSAPPFRGGSGADAKPSPNREA